MSDRKLAAAIEINNEKFDTHNLLISNLYKITVSEGYNEYGSNIYYIFANSFEEVNNIVTEDLGIDDSFIKSMEFIAGKNIDENFIFKPLNNTDQ